MFEKERKVVFKQGGEGDKFYFQYYIKMLSLANTIFKTIFLTL